MVDGSNRIVSSALTVTCWPEAPPDVARTPRQAVPSAVVRRSAATSRPARKAGLRIRVTRLSGAVSGAASADPCDNRTPDDTDPVAVASLQRPECSFQVPLVVRLDSVEPAIRPGHQSGVLAAWDLAEHAPEARGPGGVPQGDVDGDARGQAGFGVEAGVPLADPVPALG